MILFIDDEPEYITPYVDAFRLEGFEVQVISDVDVAWHIIRNNKDSVDAVFLDIMMPPGRLFSGSDTKEGLRTGLNFLHLMKQLDEHIPVICLTNADSRSFEKIDHPHCFIYEKKDMDPWQLVDKMSDIKRRKRL